jgi:hypothetical protein
VHVPIRQAVAAGVVSDQHMMFGESEQKRPSNRQLPVIFEMTEPMRRPQHRRSVADRRVRQADTIWRLAIANILLEIRRGEHLGARGCCGIEMNRINLHRLGDVLEILPAEFPIGQIKLALDLIEHLARNADAAAVRDPLQSRGDIDAIAHQIAVALLHDVTEVKANAELDALLGGQAGIALGHAVLHFDGAAHGVDDAAEFDQSAVPGSLHKAAVMHGGRWIDQVATQRPQP